MATGYTRNDTTNNIANGNVINAADLDGEFDAIQAAYDVTTGHDHDGTVGGGAPIKALGPAQDIVITTSVIRPKTDNTVDLGTSTLEFKDLFLDGTAKVDTLTVDESATIAAGLTVDTTTLVVDATNNRVGVGTASPSTTLHISSATPIITLTDTDNPHSATINTNSATGSLSISADTGNAVADSAIILNIDNTEKVRVLADGSVGIGTATPSATLDVVGGAEINGDLTVTGNTTLGNAATDTVTFTADVASNLIPSADNTYDLGASGSEWKDLYIDGTANIDALVADAATIITSTGGVLTLQRDDTAITSGETLGEIDFQAPNVSGGGDAIVVAATIKAVAGDTFDAAVNKTSLLFQTASSGAVATRMEIDGDGNTTISGILTASSDVSIADKIIHTGDTNTAIRFPAADTVTVETSGTERLRVDSSGNVGIGTSSPGAMLDLTSGNAGLGILAATNRLRFTDTDPTLVSGQTTGSVEWFTSDTDSPGVHAYIGTLGANTGAAALTFGTGVGGSSAERMRIDSAGNVGIGTTSPDALLSVNGVASFGDGSAAAPSITNFGDLNTGMFFPAADTVSVATAGAERMRIDSSGNLGLGVTPSTGSLKHIEVGAVGNAVTGYPADAAIYVTSNAVFASGWRYTQSSKLATRYAGEAGQHQWFTAPSGTAGNAITFTQAMTLDANGRLGIGTSSPQTELEISGNNTTTSSVVASISGTTMTVTTVNSGSLAVNDRIHGTGVEWNTYITALGTGTGGTGTYTVNNTQTVSSTTLYGSPAGNNILRITNTDTSEQSGQTTGGIEFFGSDSSTPGAGVKGYIALVGEDTSPDYSMLFGTSNDTASTHAVERMRITSEGNVGIGTASPGAKLEVSGSSRFFGNGSAPVNWGDTSTRGVLTYVGTDPVVQAVSGANLLFYNGTSEHARIDSSGNLLVSGTSTSPHTAGGNPAQSALLSGGRILAAVTSDAVMELNRTSTDGTIVNFRQAATVEGSISVSGTTVSYNGGHLSRWAQFPDNARPELLKGTVMSNLDQMSNWDQEDNEQLNCVQVSTVEGDANVAGVFVAWDSTEDDYNDILLAMTGDMVIRIAGGTTVQRGDLLMSAGDGTAKAQGDDIVRSKTIAKVTSTHISHTYADGSYAVPCVLMAC